MHARHTLLALALISCGAMPLTAQSTGIRDVTASDRNLIQLTTRLRYTTMVILPENEEILDVVCGDRDFWVISATQNIAHIKPAKEGAATNLNLVTARGTVYSFLLTESKAASPDLKVYVTANPDDHHTTPKFIPATQAAAQVSALETEVKDARAAAEMAQHRSDDTIAAFKEHYPSTLQFAYGTPKYQKPFYIRSIWHDGRFTYIKSDAQELPALYELHDGEASLVNFQVEGGTYVIPKILDQGYLALGKQKFAFQRER